MKILCETQVINRQTQAVKSARVTKATLAIGFNNVGKTRDENGNRAKEVEIIHFTPQNKVGVRYKVQNNIEKIFTKFVQDGKATIGFKQPPENLLIKCDPIQLKGFLQTLKLGIEGKDSMNLRLNIAAATAIPQKSQPQHKLVVLKRCDYPTKGFPKSLKSLTILGINLCKVTFEICSLRHLTSLDLSYNNLTKLPAELGRLSLVELRVNNNMLGGGGGGDDGAGRPNPQAAWSWMNGKQLQKSLQELDLSANQLTAFPPALVKCERLVTLKLNNNEIQRVPFGVRRLQNLRYFHITVNKLESLPSCFNHMRLEMLDVWDNHFKPQIEPNFDGSSPSTASAAAATPPPPTATARANVLNAKAISPLWLLASRVVLEHKLPYTPSTLPWLLVDILSESPICACGKLCYAPTSIFQRASLSTFSNVKNLIFSREYSIYADIVLCGPTCAGRKQVHL